MTLHEFNVLLVVFGAPTVVALVLMFCAWSVHAGGLRDAVQEARERRRAARDRQRPVVGRG